MCKSHRVFFYRLAELFLRKFFSVAFLVRRIFFGAIFAMHYGLVKSIFEIATFKYTAHMT